MASESYDSPKNSRPSVPPSSSPNLECFLAGCLDVIFWLVSMVSKFLERIIHFVGVVQKSAQKQWMTSVPEALHPTAAGVPPTGGGGAQPVAQVLGCRRHAVRSPETR